MANDFRIAAWLVEPQLNSVSRNGTTVHLEPKVMEVLVCLAHHAHDPVPKEKLLEAVWPGTFVTDDVLKRSISELRRVFEDDPRESRIIQTIPKRGYRLLVPVEPVNGARSASATLQRESRMTVGKWRAVALVFGVGALLSALASLSVHSLRKHAAGGSASPQIRSIAVLPLENLSGDPSQEYLSDGMTDALITDVAQIDSLKVISRTSSMQYKQTKKSLPEIAHELNVDGIIEGTVQRSGDRVRITAQLILGASDKNLWAHTYEGDFRDAFVLERDVTEDIARRVQLRVTTQNQTAPSQLRSTNPNALEAYLQGNYHLNKYGRGSGVEERKKAAEYFQQAINADPNFVRAYVGLANAHGDLPVSSHEDWEIQRKAAENALALDPSSSDAWTILAGPPPGEKFDWPATEQGFRHAIALNSNNAEAHGQFCEFLAEMGRLDEALRECQVAQELDPNSDHLATILYERREYDHSIAILRMMIERHPDDGEMHYLLFDNYVKKQNYKEAVEELEKTLTLYGFSDAAAKIHHAFTTAGYRAAMRRAAEQCEHLQETRQFYLPVNIADVYAVLGEKDRAFYWLEQAFTNREMISTGEGVTFIGVDPMLETLRPEPRFKDLLRRIGLSQ